MARANDYRHQVIKQKSEIGGNASSQLSLILQAKSELEEQRKLDVLNKVVLKHHEKEKKQKKALK